MYSVNPAWLLFLLLLCFAGPLAAQPTTRPCYDVAGSPSCQTISVATPLPVIGSFSASLGGFTPATRGTPVSVTTSDSSGTLPAGTVVVVSNVGANPMYCNVNGNVATTSDQYISTGGGWFAFTTPSGQTTLHCIATGGTTTANTVGGAGLPTGTGGGGGGSSSNASVSATGAAVPASATYLGITSGGNLTGWNGAVTGTVTANAGTNLNTSALATSANQTNASQKTQIVDGSGNIIASTSNNLNVQCANCYVAGDEAAFTAGTSAFLGTGGFFQTTATNNPLTTGQLGMFQVTANRALFSNLRNAAGVEIGTSATPVQVSLANTGANGTALVTNPATPANWGIGAFASAMPINGVGIGLFDGTNMVRAKGDETNGIWVNIKAGAGSGGTAIADKAAWTVSSTNFTLAGGEFTTGGATACGTAQACTVGMTASRGFFQDMNTWAETSLGVPTAYGTAPVSGNYIGVNAFVTNTNANGQATMANSSPVVIASNQSNLPTNTAQVNGVTVLTGTGATGTGAQRVTVSTDQATNAGAALVKGGIGVVNGGSTYQAVAASQTATVLQTSAGAAGDYLSHCNIYPTSTSPGVVTVFDNANTAATSAILFPGGASSLSNLAPIPMPVGAISTAGAWKVTTGANVSVTCFGKFS